jgi:hypothetical protein
MEMSVWEQGCCFTWRLLVAQYFRTWTIFPQHQPFAKNVLQHDISSQKYWTFVRDYLSCSVHVMPWPGWVRFSIIIFFLFMVRLSDRKVLRCWTKVIERTKRVFLSSFNSSWTTDTNIIQTYLALYYLDIIYIILYKISKLYTLCYLVILSRKTTLCNSLSAYNNLKPHI